MGSKERILRLKEDTRRKILETAITIIKAGGCDALSMRKIADQIDYTAPIIYEYFKNKEGIYIELARMGHLILANKVRLAKETQQTAEDQMTAMWIAYWDFASSHREYYQMMYGIDIVCFPKEMNLTEAEAVPKMIAETIRFLFKDNEVTDDQIQIKYHTYWSVVHGLIAINMIKKNTIMEMNRQILTDTINNITLSIVA